MKTYIVQLTKVHQYTVEANNVDEAEEQVLDIDADKAQEIKWATDPYDKIIVERLC